MIRRPTVDEYFTIMAMHASSRASCIRRRVGCVLTNDKNHVLATGYNGPPAGVVNCTTHPCKGAHYPSGQGLNMCQAIHAEHNAIMQCSNIYVIKTAYVTATPCLQCVDLLMNTSCERIVYLQPYAASHSGTSDIWRAAGKEIVHITDIIDKESPVYMFANVYGFEL